MKHDKPLIAALFGCFSTIAAEITSRILLAFGIGKYTVYQLDSLFITINRPNELIGFIITSTISGTIAVILYYLFARIGYDYIILKCLLVNILAWVVLETLSMALLETKLIEIRPISDYYVHFTSTIADGIVLGFLLRRYLLPNPAARHG